MTLLRRQGADAVRKGRPWSFPLEDRALLVAAYWRTNLTRRRLAPLSGISKSAAERIIDSLGPMLALQPRKRFAKGTVLIVDGTLVPTRDHTIAERSKNYRYSTSHQVVIDADTRMVAVVGRPLARNRNDCKAWEESGAKAAVGKTLTVADDSYPVNDPVYQLCWVSRGVQATRGHTRCPREGWPVHQVAELRPRSSGAHATSEPPGGRPA